MHHADSSLMDYSLTFVSTPKIVRLWIGDFTIDDEFDEWLTQNLLHTHIHDII